MKYLFGLFLIAAGSVAYIRYSHPSFGLYAFVGFTLAFGGYLFGHEYGELSAREPARKPEGKR